MLVVGIVGGVACGKSLVADQFRRLGAEVLSGDTVGHEVLHDPEVKALLREQWGPAVIDPTGEVDRVAVARLVFEPTPAGRERLAWLEQLTHPRIGARLHEQLETLAARGNVPVAVLDAPVLIKAGWDKYCDQIVFVEVPRDVRLARARQRGWSESDLARREAAQEPLETKRARAQAVIDNSGLPAQTAAAVARYWQTLVREATGAEGTALTPRQ